jgi:hypothetical protein
MSIEDASAELCGLLRAVGPTASFRFECMAGDTASAAGGAVGGGGGPQVMTMVFQFPPDFEKKAYSAERNESVKQVLWNIVFLLWKIFKVVIAFGLVLSLVILIIGGLCAMVAAIVIMARGGGGGGGGHHHSHRQYHQRLVSQMRSLLLTLRQLLWFYVIFGDGLDHMEDPFLRETAHTLVLGLNLLLGSPRSIWFWWNAQRLRDRQRRRGGMGRLFCCDSSRMTMTSWRNSWRQEGTVETEEVGERTSTNHDNTLIEGSKRGIVSIAAEFLFGPTPFWPRPSVLERWKIREKYIVTKSIESIGNGVNLMQFLAFTDDPPCIKIQEDSDDDDAMNVLASSWDARVKCLHIVSHFNGVPMGSTLGNNFVFPELMAEAVSTTPLQFYSTSSLDEEDASWRSFFHASEDSSLLKMNGYHPKYKDRMKAIDDVPEYMHEQRHVLTKLTDRQFSQCLFLNVLNYVGIIMLRMSICKGGALEVTSAALLTVLNGILSILELYARLFFAVPFCRGLILVLLNYRLDKRNQRRRKFAQWIQSKQQE